MVASCLASNINGNYNNESAVCLYYVMEKNVISRARDVAFHQGST